MHNPAYEEVPLQQSENALGYEQNKYLPQADDIEPEKSKSSIIEAVPMDASTRKNNTIREGLFVGAYAGPSASEYIGNINDGGPMSTVDGFSVINCTSLAECCSNPGLTLDVGFTSAECHAASSAPAGDVNIPDDISWSSLDLSLSAIKHLEKEEEEWERMTFGCGDALPNGHSSNAQPPILTDAEIFSFLANTDNHQYYDGDCLHCDLTATSSTSAVAKFHSSNSNMRELKNVLFGQCI